MTSPREEWPRHSPLVGVFVGLGLGPKTGTAREGDPSMPRPGKNGPRHSPLVGVFVGLGLGLLFLAVALNRPTIAKIRFHDLVFLLGTGACFGAGMVVLVRFFIV